MAPSVAAGVRRWGWLAIAGIVGYVAIDLALAALRPDVSLLHDPESDYGNGAWSWLMDLNFLIRAGLSIAAIVAVAPAVGFVSGGRPETAARVGVALIAVWAVASGMLAFFPDDLRGTVVTGHGRIHLLAAFVAFVAAAIGTIALSRALAGARGWARASELLTGVGIAALLALLLLGSTGLREHSLGGLWERLFLALVLAWLLIASAGVVRGRVGGESGPVGGPS